ncbi:ROK family transcriptional regulator [Microbacterium sp. NPDC076768]|uniref:ROK family transcriptional regulator n=1 Tax=Microbacterium sp. NPDC076768 TaxID=3154858 RepID=UPI003425D45E
MNRSAVLTELLRSRPVSRTQIAQSIGVSAATVSRVVDQLTDEGLVHELSAVVSESRGRRPVLLDVVADNTYVVGVDIGAANTRYVVADLVGSVVTSSEVTTPTNLSADGLADWVASEVKQAAGERWPLVRYACVGLPGAVNREQGTVSNAPNLPQVEDPRFLDALHTSFGVPLDVDNDVNYALLGEQRFGIARGQSAAAMLNLGAGLGAALAVDGAILHGRRGLIGEFGHLPVGVSGDRVEHLVTGPGIMRQAADASVDLDGPGDLFADSPARPLAQLRTHFDHALLVVLTALTVSCDPETIILGGGISKSLASSLPRYEDALKENLNSSPRLVLPQLGDMSGAVGAAVSGLHRVYPELGVAVDALATLPRRAE